MTSINSQDHCQSGKDINNQDHDRCGPSDLTGQIIIDQQDKCKIDNRSETYECNNSVRNTGHCEISRHNCYFDHSGQNCYNDESGHKCSDQRGDSANETRNDQRNRDENPVRQQLQEENDSNRVCITDDVIDNNSVCITDDVIDSNRVYKAGDVIDRNSVSIAGDVSGEDNKQDSFVITNQDGFIKTLQLAQHCGLHHSSSAHRTNHPLNTSQHLNTGPSQLVHNAGEHTLTAKHCNMNKDIDEKSDKNDVSETEGVVEAGNTLEVDNNHIYGKSTDNRKDDDNLKDDKNAGDDKENIVDESDTAGTNDDALGSYDTVDGYILQKLLPTRKESLIFENPPAIELTSFQKRQQGENSSDTDGNQEDCNHLKLSDDDKLQHYLLHFSNRGLPGIPISIKTDDNDDNSIPTLDENYWSNFRMRNQTLNIKEQSQQEALWELVKTEVDYISAVTVIVDVFLSCLLYLQNKHLLTELDINCLFANIVEIRDANIRWWKMGLSKMLEHSSRTNSLLNPTILSHTLNKFEQTFQPYIAYCVSQNDMCKYIRQKMDNCELFRTFLSWAESQEKCRRLTLVDLMAKPFQRVTKYRLLLAAIIKNTDDVSQCNVLKQLEKEVDGFLHVINKSIQESEDDKKLKALINNIGSYDVIKRSNERAKLIDSWCKLNLMQPVPNCPSHVKRILFHEGTLTMEDSSVILY